MARAIARSIAAVVEQLELDGDVVVTFDQLATIAQRLGRASSDANTRLLAYTLQREGWLGPLRTRHAWEFLPGSRAGAYSSGDRFIEFRAQHAVKANWSGVLAMESAASVLGLAQRIPEQEVVALPDDEPFPKALTGAWRYVRIDIPVAGRVTANGLPSWNLEGLIVGIATRPSAYKDIAGFGQWLPGAAARADTDSVIRLLARAPRTTAQRAAYLLGVGGNQPACAAIVDAYPPTETAWLGPRVAGRSAFDRSTQVNDTLLHPYLEVGTGS